MLSVIREASQQEAGSQGIKSRLWCWYSVPLGGSLSSDNSGGFYFYFKKWEIFLLGWSDIIDPNSLEMYV